MILQTNSLVLRPYTEADFTHVFRLQSDAEVMRYIRAPATEMASVLERTHLWLRYAEENPGYGVWVMEQKSDGLFAGYCVLRHVDFIPGREIEVGYTLDKASWGKGFATEATKALMYHASQALGIRNFVAFTDENNMASNRVLEKCGFSPVGKEIIYGGECLKWSMNALPLSPQIV
jgi:RimJ/RimL family protein N-acetyltransferase